MIFYNGYTKPLIEWAEEFSINKSTLSNRLGKYGWSIERALTEPIELSCVRRTDERRQVSAAT